VVGALYGVVLSVIAILELVVFHVQLAALFRTIHGSIVVPCPTRSASMWL
jgi:hypothetical protein